MTVDGVSSKVHNSGHNKCFKNNPGDYEGNEWLLARDQNRDGIIFPQQDLEGALWHPIAMSQLKKCTGEAKDVC